MALQQALGISLGTRKIAFAVLEGYSIFDCQMKFFREPWSDQKLESILRVIESYITRYQINQIALKTPPPFAHTPAIIELMQAIDSLSHQKQCNLYEFSLQQLKKAW